MFFVSGAFLPLLAKGSANNHGYSASIVNVASISGMMRGSSSGQYAYASSKAAALHLSKMLGNTLAQAKVCCRFSRCSRIVLIDRSQIRVNTIAPGIFPSEMTAGESDEHNKSNIDSKGKGLPAGRPGKDSDMATAILYLVGPCSTFTNGQVLYPDGGAVLTQPAAM
jgi:NAD(P)-dependent dehydrogenase (short-subunit alcohol dehydrogenase family)